MSLVIRVTALTVAGAVVFLQIGCGDATADEKEKALEPTAEAPVQSVQPAKPVTKTDEEWKRELTPEQYAILRKHDTERPWGEVYEEFKKQGEGTYYCVGCNAELFSSQEKFDPRCGWPSFYDASKHENIKTVRDTSLGMVRVEVRCAVCDGHLGHIFEGEGYNTPTDQRYCINGKVLKFVPKDHSADEETGQGKPVDQAAATEEKD